MSHVPRVAVGTVQPEADCLPMLWALSEVLRQSGLCVEHFLSRACFTAHHGGEPAGATAARHLDTWLMSQQLCRDIFVHGAKTADLALVEGRFDEAIENPAAVGGRLELLCQWLDLPKLAVVDVRLLDCCLLPKLPEGVEGLLLDRVHDRMGAALWQTRLESLWGIPVLGALEELPALRRAIRQLPSGRMPPRELCETLAGRLGRYFSLRRTLEIASRRCEAVWPTSSEARISPLAELTVAVAFDDAFHCYFADTLDLLELQGARVIDYSPLRDAELPPETDVVYLGCGHPERYHEPLAANRCMASALAQHVSSGGRIYAEGGGLAYLCDGIRLPDGQLAPMTGILPAIARPNPNPQPPEPVEITLAHGNWLGEGWARVRGYRNTFWQLEPTGPLTRYAAEPGHEMDLVGCRQAIGSRIHLNFAAQPEFLRAFFNPHGSKLDAEMV